MTKPLNAYFLYSNDWIKITTVQHQVSELMLWEVVNKIQRKKIFTVCLIK